MNDEITLTLGRRFYSFDGRILEIFGGDPARFHVRNMYIKVTGPDRKGRRVVEIGHTRGNLSSWTYTAEEWAEARGLGEFLETVQAAIDAV